ncbi:hypothetical protein OIU78_002878, partial [Salix suchowensis]
MGGERKKVFVGLMVAMILGFAVYFRLWTIDYAISSDDTELIRFLSFSSSNHQTHAFIVGS